mmetsp:Transcript_68856/g.136223  ORF Transcript_68856/g.136223 Transcript_68856/m.136223 type:complete len:435 (+) Transcript_68856:47-1351(+)|eukprot:CAMPEP_0172727156 /NCGR_PEP_ID=MMETSP1074-20121228/91520_1 /TAXON_ID=2916 /ORGANISM="Ceratium fusus, Strain PA161109" /LENGTH=434 /DNA_ID=CAMNT_0013554279 /DNA_START=40 /DNA_END=1344 /DNA_ORIENTATION=-
MAREEAVPLLSGSGLPNAHAIPEQFEEAFHSQPVHLLDQIEEYWKKSAGNDVAQVAPQLRGEARAPVYATVSLVSFSDISPLTNSFEAKIKIYLQWEVNLQGEQAGSNFAEQAEKEGAGYHSLDPEEIEDFRKLVEIPSVGFFNELSREEADNVGVRVYRRKRADGLNTVMWYHAWNFRFTQAFDLHDFPYDTQKLQLMLELNNWKTWKKYHLVVVAICIHSDAAHISQFDLACPTILSEAPGSVIAHRRRTLQVKISRQWHYYMHNIVAVFMMLSAISMLSFAIDVDKLEERLSLLVTIFLTVVAFKFTLELPKLSYITKLDSYMLQMMGLLFVCCFMVSLTTVLANMSKEYSLKWEWIEVKESRVSLDRKIAMGTLVATFFVHLRFILLSCFRDHPKPVKHVEGKKWLCYHYAHPFFLPELRRPANEAGELA